MQEAKELKKQGVDLSNEFFKEAKVDDDEGMAKYGVDLDEDSPLEKLSN